MTSASYARDVAASLEQGDHISLDRKTVRGALGVAALIIGCLTRTDDFAGLAPVRLVIANPISHGARLGAAVIDALPPDATVICDHRLAEPELSRGSSFPSLAPRSIGRIVTWSRLRSAVRLRRALGAMPRGASRLHGEYLFLAQAIRFSAARQALREDRPRLLLVDFDRHSYAAPWVHAAKDEGVVTATLVHGTPNAWNYLPVLADHVLVWGEVQRDWMRNHGVRAGVQIIGRPDVSDAPLPDRAPHRLIVAHSAERLSETEVARILERAVSARAAGHEVVLRLHPSVPTERLDSRWRSIADVADQVVSGHGSLSAELRNGDILAVVGSSSAMDALAKGGHVEVLADSDRPLPADLEALAARSEDTGIVDPSSHIAAVDGEAKHLLREWVQGAIRDTG